MAHYISYSLFDNTRIHGITVVILELIHDLISNCPRVEGWSLLDTEPVRGQPRFSVNHDKMQTDRSDPSVGGASFKFLPYQLSMVRYWPTMVATGNGESGFDSGEGA